MKISPLITCILFSISSAAVAQTTLVNLTKPWRFTIGNDPSYASPDYDDRDWELIDVPARWEDEGFANYNGFAWYRTTFDGKDLGDHQNIILNIGYIDDVHEVYLNGELVGFKGAFPPHYFTAYDILNKYNLPNTLINRSSINTIAIKVYDKLAEGGIVKGSPRIYAGGELPDDFYSLEGVWAFSSRSVPGWKMDYIDERNWNNIFVPSHWRSIGFTGRNGGYGWYRKAFNLPYRLRGQDIYLLLGKIDDFDKTYFNGELIGETYDRKGSEESWSKFRMYKIPERLIKQLGTNVIAVEVKDKGGEAGIYEGPIGLVSEETAKVINLLLQATEK